MGQQDKKKERRKEPSKKSEEVQANPEVIEKGKRMAEDLDHLMDEIDGVLEENSEEFVKNYVQKGGE